MSSTRLTNNEVHFSVINKDNTPFLICHSRTIRFKVRYVENLRTGKRAFPEDIPDDAHDILDALDRSQGLEPEKGDADKIIDRLIDLAK